MKIYVAGPYTKGDVARNVANAIAAAESLLRIGHVPYVPHLTHFWHMQYEHSVETWYSYDNEWLDCCNALLRLPGDSVGADLEVQRARNNGMVIFYDIASIPSYAEDMSKATGDL